MKPVFGISIIILILLLVAGLWLTFNSPDGFFIDEEKERLLISKDDLLESGRFFDLRDRQEVLISLVDSFFQPQKIIIDPGTKIFWKNEDSVKHTVRFENEEDFTILEPGGVMERVFNEEGEYWYYDENFSDKMAGLIIVEQQATSN